MNMQALMSSKTPAYLRADDRNQSMVVEASLHWRVHMGHMFSFSEKYTIAPSGSIVLSLLAGQYNVHWDNYEFKSNDGPVDVEFFRTPTLSSEGSSQEAINRNDVSVLISETQIYSHASTSLTSPGSRLFIDGVMADAALGGAADAASLVSQREEWILKANTRYLVRLTNNGASTATAYAEFMFYEERTDSTTSSTYST